MQLIIAFRNFANTPKTEAINFYCAAHFTQTTTYITQNLL